MSEPMIDHMGLSVADFGKGLAFYEKALAPLGVRTMMRYGAKDTGKGELAGLGGQTPFFWIGEGEATRPPQHIAFRAGSRAQVDAFYHAAIAAGGKDNGGPGLRPHYHATYYGAFVIDPEGHNVEAVCHRPE